MKKAKINQKFVVLEGGDGAGKGTQTDLLLQRLRVEKIIVSKHDFPQYETSLFGGIVGRALKGEFGDFKNLSPYLSSLPYTLDRVSARPILEADLRRGVIVSNRYTPSNIAYQAAKLKGKKRQDFVHFIEHAEYRELDLPEPTLVIYLFVPVEVAQKLVEAKDTRSYLGKGGKGKKDQHEADLGYQKRVVDTYSWLAKSRPSWKIINCTRRGKLLSREEIHAQVFTVVKEHLGI